MTQTSFTEADTEALFDDVERDQRFRSFWHPDGSLHWGYFENLASAQPEDFVPACDRWDAYMLQQSGITAESRVLEVACGNGNAAIWIAQQTGCEVVGIDLSSSYIDNA
ncbi:MAG: methyltransferase domain-containing protein, partial [Symploca sp. SIO1C2]|nr:methyltransferase domain-containing protein [Symploca sp. SIO1C2]